MSYSPNLENNKRDNGFVSIVLKDAIKHCRVWSVESCQEGRDAASGSES